MTSPVKIVVTVVVALRVRATSSAPRVTWPASIIGRDAWYPSTGVTLLERGTPVSAWLRAHECSALTSPSFSPAGDTRHIGWGIWCLEGAQYPVTSIDGGQHWRVAGRYVAAVGVAGAGSEVTVMVAMSPSGAFAYSPGGSIVDVTSDAGRHWYSAAFVGDVADTPGDVVSSAAGNIEVKMTQRTVTHATSTQWYATTDHGRIWRHGAGGLSSSTG